MKAHLLLIIGVILFLPGCIVVNRPTSHVPVMPNEPMFERNLQVQGSIAASFDHSEAQAAVSVTKFLGLTGGVYGGSKGISQREYGVNLFAPLNKKHSFFASLSAGKGQGRFRGHYDIKQELFGGSTYYTLNTEFNSFYIQPSVYYIFNTEEGRTLKFSLSLKHQEIFFNKFFFTYTDALEKPPYSSLFWRSENNYSITSTAPNAYAILRTVFIGCSYESDNNPFYLNAQLGGIDVARSFKATFYEGKDNYEKHKDKFSDISHPLFGKVMVNISIGLKIDPDKFREIF